MSIYFNKHCYQCPKDKLRLFINCFISEDINGSNSVILCDAGVPASVQTPFPQGSWYKETHEEGGFWAKMRAGVRTALAHATDDRGSGAADTTRWRGGWVAGRNPARAPGPLSRPAAGDPAEIQASAGSSRGKAAEMFSCHLPGPVPCSLRPNPQGSTRMLLFIRSTCPPVYGRGQAILYMLFLQERIQILIS